MTYNLKNFLLKLDLSGDLKDCNNGNYPKISIVMPCFNQVRFVERSILSIINQRYSNLDFIIIDGGSTDGSVEIIKKYEKYLSYWISEPDKGQSDALNKGFAIAKGDIYGWMNSDDLYLPDSFCVVASKFQENPEAKIIFGDWLEIDVNDVCTAYHHAFDFNLNQFKYEGFHMNAQSMFWRNKVHSKFSGFDVDLHNTMDYQMIIEFGLHEKENTYKRLPIPLGCFRRYEAQKTGNFSDRVLREHRSIAEKYNFSDKYAFLGSIKRHAYRWRRAFWYLRRGGFPLLLKNLIK
jgi:glycosyltransferase involved in cell wall biosynthesis